MQEKLEKDFASTRLAILKVKIKYQLIMQHHSISIYLSSYITKTNLKTTGPNSLISYC